MRYINLLHFTYLLTYSSPLPNLKIGNLVQGKQPPKIGWNRIGWMFYPENLQYIWNWERRDHACYNIDH